MDVAHRIAPRYTVSSIRQRQTLAMKHTLHVLLLAALLPLRAVLGADSPADPLAGAFFPPELIQLTRDQIGLTQAQQEAFRSRTEKTQLRSEELRGKLERETAALVTLAKQNRVDEAVILAQLDKVLDAERELKHLHLGLMVAIKNLLTPEQEAKLQEIAASSKRLTRKVQDVQSGARRWADSGRDPSAIAQAMEKKVKPLIEAGKVIEAEAELDRVLELLKKDAK
jgi:Spy/CpxP family protein refolding chaperone